MSYLLVDMDSLSGKKTEYVITDFILPLPIPVNSPSIPRYLSTVFGLTVPSAWITGICEYAGTAAKALVRIDVLDCVSREDGLTTKIHL